ncbi:hypothetical protein WJX84_002443 [Apatococcus fuscideae]|uniref:GYF domain-containing protein n=1 Tax=Apatococcus fuscideae TaxID=2026836 RepID=A0AAW1TKK6_9CHLO
MLEARCKLPPPLQVEATLQCLAEHSCNIRPLEEEWSSLQDSCHALLAVIHTLIQYLGHRVEDEQWFYNDPKGLRRGPYSAQTLRRWAKLAAFVQTDEHVELNATGLLLPLSIVTAKFQTNDQATSESPGSRASAPDNMLNTDMDWTAELLSFRQTRASHLMAAGSWSLCSTQIF